MTTLTVRCGASRPGTTQYAFTLWTSDASTQGPLEQEYVVDVNQSLVQASCQEIDQALEHAKEKPAELKEILRSEGRLLYKQLLQPPGGNVLELVSQLRKSTESLIVQSNESVVPWELLHDGTEFLGLQIDMGRRTVVSSQVLGGRDIGPVRRALVVGDTLGDLRSAREEVERISAWLTEQDIEHLVLTGAQATLRRIIRELTREEDPYDLFHFSGHVASVPGADGLLVHHREVIDDLALRTLAGRGAPPVVFINGCASAGLTMGVCRSFMQMGAKTVVGTRTVVDDASALRFAMEFYDGLRQLRPAGMAVRMARQALADTQDDSWASFVLYGDPNVQINTEKQPPAPQPGPLKPEPVPNLVEQPGRPFAPDAEALLQRVKTAVGFRGMITSIDLLAGLLAEKAILERALRRVGPQRIELLRELLADLRAVDQETAQDIAKLNGNRPEIVLSDTVTRVLLLADETVAAAGRATVTVEDIAAALLGVGGSFSAELLERFAITMEELLAPADATATQHVGEPVRMAGFDARAAGVIQCARLLAVARGESVVSTYVLLKAFAVTGSDALRKVVQEQGKDVDQTLRRLANLADPHTGSLSVRVAAVVQGTSRPDDPAGEEDLLRALLADPDSTAGKAMAKLGLDAEQAVRDLSPGE